MKKRGTKQKNTSKMRGKNDGLSLDD